MLFPALISLFGAYLLMDEEKSYGKGGKIDVTPDKENKYKKIGITDKYTIQAIEDIGLSGVNFTKEDIDKRIEKEFKDLISKHNGYIVNKDSNAITKTIENEIQTRYEQGDTDENIATYKTYLTNQNQRDRYIKSFADTQKETINEWVNYLKQSEYDTAFKYLILKSVLTHNYDLKLKKLIERTNTTIRNFTSFDAGTLGEIYANKSNNLLIDYINRLNTNIDGILKAKELVKTSTGGRWIKFDGGSKTPEEQRAKNAKDLSKLVQDTYWCTKTNSKQQLDGGDFYVYVTESDNKLLPRIAVLMFGDRVSEVRGNASSAQDIEPEMLPIAKDFLIKNIPNGSGKIWIDSIEYNLKAKNLYDKLNDTGLLEGSLEEYIEVVKDENKHLLDYADRNGHIVRLESLFVKLIKKPNKIYKKGEIATDINEVNRDTICYISEYDDRSFTYYYEIEKVVSDKLKYIIGSVRFLDCTDNLKGLKIISGDANFNNSEVKDLGNLQSIGGGVDFGYSQIKDLGNLQKIGGDAYFKGSEVIDLGNLQTIGGNAKFSNSRVTNLGNLQTIRGEADFRNSQVKDLGKLKEISGHVFFSNSQIESLGNLQTIGGAVDFKNSKIKSLGNLKSIGNSAYFRNSQVKDLGNLQSIGGSANFDNNQLKDLGNLQIIGRDADFNYSQIESLGNLKTIGGDANFSDSEIKDLANLQSIGNNANFYSSKVKDLGNLQSIGRNAHFVSSQIRSLGKLQRIGLDADFRMSQVEDIGNLQSIGGNANFSGSKIKDIGNLQSIGGNADFSGSKIKDLGNLQSIGMGAYFRNSEIKNLGNLQSIGRGAYFEDSEIKDLGNLQSIGGDANFSNSQVKDLGNLKTIGGNADFGSEIESLGNLQSIGGAAIFIKSQINNLGNLKSIGGVALFGNSKIKDLGNLQSIGLNVDFRNSQVANLGNLQSIGSDAYFSKSKINNLGNLQSIGGDAHFEDSEIKDLGNLQSIVGDVYFGNRQDLRPQVEAIQKKQKS